MAWRLLPWRFGKGKRRKAGAKKDRRSGMRAASARQTPLSPQERALRRIADPFTLSGGLFELGSDGPLGRRGERLALPFDNVIFPIVMKTGAWQAEDLEFLARHLDPSTRYMLLDIGANIGLFTRQAARLLPNIDRFACVEPDAANFAALRYNLSMLPEEKLSLWNVGLGHAAGVQTFFRDRSNIGNYSLNADAMRDRPFEEAAIRTVETGAWMQALLPSIGGAERLIWKSDTQGHDELIVSRTPLEIWSRVDAAVIELWRIEKPPFDRAAFERRLDAFPHRAIGADGGGTATTGEVMDYLAGVDGAARELFLWR